MYQKSQEIPNTSIIAINDANWYSNMACIFVWFVYWLIIIGGNIYFLGGYIYPLSNLAFLISAILIIASIINKKYALYKIGFVFYIIHVVISILIMGGILVIIFFFYEYCEKILGITLDSTPNVNNQKQQAKDLFHMGVNIIKASISICFGIVLITEICFLCYLRSKFGLFKSYESYLLQKSQEGLSPIGVS